MSKVQRVVQLFKEMLRASNNFTDYNFRKYFTRRVTEEFEKHKNIKSLEDQEKYIAQAEETLAMLKRQSTISQFYQGLKLPIE